MAISDPLDLPWTHAYWVEGPEFIASRTEGGGFSTGSVAMGSGSSTLVSLWPDEVGSLDLSQADEARQPTYDATNATWGHPAIVYDSSLGMFLKSSLLGSPLSQPWDVVVICRRSVAGAAYRVAFDAHTNQIQVGTNVVPNDWLFFQSPSGGFGPVGGGTPDTNKHLLRARGDATDELFVDEVSQGSGAAGTLAIDGVTAGARDGFNCWEGEIVFIGVADTVLSAGQISDLLSWATTYYSL